MSLREGPTFKKSPGRLKALLKCLCMYVYTNSESKCLFSADASIGKGDSPTEFISIAQSMMKELKGSYIAFCLFVTLHMSAKLLSIHNQERAIIVT